MGQPTIWFSNWPLGDAYKGKVPVRLQKLRKLNRLWNQSPQNMGLDLQPKPNQVNSLLK